MDFTLKGKILMPDIKEMMELEGTLFLREQTLFLKRGDSCFVWITCGLVLAGVHGLIMIKTSFFLYNKLCTQFSDGVKVKLLMAYTPNMFIDDCCYNRYIMCVCVCVCV